MKVLNPQCDDKTNITFNFCERLIVILTTFSNVIIAKSKKVLT